MSVRLFLALDNCYASKRWCSVGEWMRVVKDLGVDRVEASADNEIDPLYTTAAYRADWLRAVRREGERSGVQVVNLYSGHGTYATLGLAHHDARVRHHLASRWMGPMLRLAGNLHAGLGCFAHAFSEEVLAEPRRQRATERILIDNLQELSAVAERSGARSFSIEQMRSPHQPPWTIAGTTDFLRETNRKVTGLPIHLTIDTGHQSGQRGFRAPSAAEVTAFVRALRQGQRSSLYLGTGTHCQHIADLVRSGASVAEVKARVAALVDAAPYLFSATGDDDPYRWLREFAPYAPIIHLQQTDNTASAHRHFTPANNRTGVIHAEQVVTAIADSYQRPRPAGFPPRVETIHLTLEPFLDTAGHPRLMLEDLAESVSYWRRVIPHEGLLLPNLPLEAKENVHAITVRNSHIKALQ
jgi:hypothetical protein